MNFLSVITKLVPFIIQLAIAAEHYFKETSSGADKKAAVKSGVKAIFDGAAEASTGGQKETFTGIEPVVDKAIDIVASLLFPKD